ncbi:MAG TPA: magnesium/cobalt transporter CorA [Candidatus Sphingobacterium stercoripullorum]|nr:magnesium/cobalt transporter CorA [Candidatus Sphingobacterium stercoripullorum]
MKNRKIKKPILNRRLADPNSYTYTGATTKDPSVAPSWVKYTYSSEKFLEEKSPSLAELTIKKDEATSQWVDITGISEDKELITFFENNGIHRLTIQDILDVNQRPKFQQFDSYSFLTLKTFQATGQDWKVVHVNLILKDNCIVSCHNGKDHIFAHIKERLKQNKGVVRKKSIPYLLYLMVESLLDGYFRVINDIEEKSAFTDSSKKIESNFQKIESLEANKRKIFFIKKSILPLRDFITKFERGELPIEKELNKYYYELKDLCLTIIDECDILLNATESDINLFFSMQGQRMNQIMKTLTVVATIFIPLTFIAGVYGMNFINMPELTLKYGYAATWGVFVIIALIMIYYFKKKDYF